MSASAVVQIEVVFVVVVFRESTAGDDGRVAVVAGGGGASIAGVCEVLNRFQMSLINLETLLIVPEMFVIFMYLSSI